LLCPQRRPAAALWDNDRMAQTRDSAMWAVVLALAFVLGYIAFRAYLAPDLLLNFVNTLYC